MMIKLFLLSLASILFALHPAGNEIDDFYAELSRTVEEGDFEGYAALYHEDAVLVNGISGTSVPIATALAGWKPGFDDTKAGRMEAGVEFRFTDRIHDEMTAHDTGIFRYYSQTEGADPEPAYIHFQALFVRSDGEWKMMMEYQSELASHAEWEDLE
ncbi:MAG: nuclear transport factor 2 family protein [Balneolaceae bacterium]